MKQFTFNLRNKSSPQAHEHITLRFHNGAVEALSRDDIKSVCPTWEHVGEYVDGAVFFRPSKVPVKLLEIAATGLFMRGWRVRGAMCRPPVEGRGYDVEIIPSGAITNPDSLKGNIRHRSASLGSVGKGERGAATFGARYKTDPQAMRDAIRERELARLLTDKWMES